MPRAFLVKKPCVSTCKRNWSELPDEQRGEIYVPGAARGRFAGARPRGPRELARGRRVAPLPGGRAPGSRVVNPESRDSRETGGGRPGVSVRPEPLRWVSPPTTPRVPRGTPLAPLEEHLPRPHGARAELDGLQGPHLPPTTPPGSRCGRFIFGRRPDGVRV